LRSFGCGSYEKTANFHFEETGQARAHRARLDVSSSKALRSASRRGALGSRPFVSVARYDKSRLYGKIKTAIDELLDETHVPLDTSWFDNNPDIYLNSHAFKNFEELSGLNLSDLSSPDLKTRLAVQKDLEKQSYLISAVRWKIGDLMCPYMYTHEPNILEGMPTYEQVSLNQDLEKSILGSDQLDSLRRRNFAISFAMQAEIIKGLREQFGRPISMNNLGSGINIDVFNSLVFLHDQFPDEKFVETVYCYDINKSFGAFLNQ